MSLVGVCMTPQPCPAGNSSSSTAGANTVARVAVSGGVWRYLEAHGGRIGDVPPWPKIGSHTGKSKF
eukprot:1670613-Prymnesium_polylepis.1